MHILVLTLGLALAVVHLFAGKLRFLDVIPRSRWLSFASGISVAYVFVHLLPELARGQESLEGMRLAGLGIESHVWVVALLGLTVFYGLERRAKTSQSQRSAASLANKVERDVFVLHVTSYALYNVVIGYLLFHESASGAAAALFFWFAMAVHFFVNDYGLRQHHRERYARSGRWVLAAAVVGGAAVGMLLEVSEAVIAILVGFLGGGVVLNVLKEELPEERKSRFWPFAIGTAAYAALLLAA